MEPVETPSTVTWIVLLELVTSGVVSVSTNPVTAPAT
jgi:hypothetical protein